MDQDLFRLAESMVQPCKKIKLMEVKEVIKPWTSSSDCSDPLGSDEDKTKYNDA